MTRYRSDFSIRFYEVGPDGYASLPTVANLLQQVAGDQASQIGLSQRELASSGIGWVLRRLTVEVDRLPREAENVTVETWPSSESRGLFYRQFQILDTGNDVLIRASSIWAAFDIGARTLSSIPGTLSAQIPWENISATAPRPRALAAPERVDADAAILPRRADLDLNGHVNNAQIVGWLLDPLQDRPVETLRLVDIAFRRECGLTDAVASVACEAGSGQYRHRLSTADQEIARGETLWD